MFEDSEIARLLGALGANVSPDGTIATGFTEVALDGVCTFLIEGAITFGIIFSTDEDVGVPNVEDSVPVFDASRIDFSVVSAIGVVEGSVATLFGIRVSKETSSITGGVYVFARYVPQPIKTTMTNVAV